MDTERQCFWITRLLVKRVCLPEEFGYFNAIWFYLNYACGRFLGYLPVMLLALFLYKCATAALRRNIGPLVRFIFYAHISALFVLPIFIIIGCHAAAPSDFFYSDLGENFTNLFFFLILYIFGYIDVYNKDKIKRRKFCQKMSNFSLFYLNLKYLHMSMCVWAIIMMGINKDSKALWPYFGNAVLFWLLYCTGNVISIILNMYQLIEQFSRFGFNYLQRFQSFPSGFQRYFEYVWVNFLCLATLSVNSDWTIIGKTMLFDNLIMGAAVGVVAWYANWEILTRKKELNHKEILKIIAKSRQIKESFPASLHLRIYSSYLTAFETHLQRKLRPECTQSQLCRRLLIYSKEIPRINELTLSAKQVILDALFIYPDITLFLRLCRATFNFHLPLSSGSFLARVNQGCEWDDRYRNDCFRFMRQRLIQRESVLMVFWLKDKGETLFKKLPTALLCTVSEYL